jgi:hypothetical protein
MTFIRIPETELPSQSPCSLFKTDAKQTVIIYIQVRFQFLTRFIASSIQKQFFILSSSRDSSVGIVTRLWAGRPGLDSRQERNCSLVHNIQTGSEAHPASYPMDMGRSFPGGKADGREKLTTHLHLVPRLRMVKIYLHSPMSSRRSA